MGSHHTNKQTTKLISTSRQRILKLSTTTTSYTQSSQSRTAQHLRNGAVVSCIKSLFQTIGACIMAVVNGIAGMLKAIINAIASFFGIIVSCLTCGRGGGRRRGGHTTSHV